MNEFPSVHIMPSKDSDLKKSLRDRRRRRWAVQEVEEENIIKQPRRMVHPTSKTLANALSQPAEDRDSSMDEEDEGEEKIIKVQGHTPATSTQNIVPRRRGRGDVFCGVQDYLTAEPTKEVLPATKYEFKRLTIEKMLASAGPVPPSPKIAEVAFINRELRLGLIPHLDLHTTQLLTAQAAGKRQAAARRHKKDSPRKLVLKRLAAHHTVTRRFSV